MKNKIIASLIAVLITGPAIANWETGTPYGTGYYADDGSRFTISIRGGGAYGTAKMKNDLGSLMPEPFWEGPSGELVGESYCGGSPSACIGAGFEPLGSIDISDLGVKEKLGSFTWTTSIGVGWILPNTSGWRIEANWDHIGEADYNSIPLYEGDALTEYGVELHVLSGGVSSTVDTDIYSIMLYYDFYDGCRGPKSTCKMIPYVGFGIGYASSTTVMSLTDIYGDLSDQGSMLYFGDPDDAGTRNFYTSETRTGNFAASFAVGVSYGLTEYMYLDAGLRINYIPKIKWGLNNSETETSNALRRSKDMFSATNVIYGSFLVGLRFEF